jgi:DNA helicase II / ATP-dependent DNA helicase PcrA
MPWHDNLDRNSPAYAIASSESRFNRIVAGPGTGKSFALKRRVARLLESGAEPARILPVTFTNVAAEDLQREIDAFQILGLARAPMADRDLSRRLLRPHS